MFKRDVLELMKIYEKNKAFFEKIRNDDKELYMAFRTDGNNSYISIYCGSVVFAQIDKKGIQDKYSVSIKNGGFSFFDGLEKCSDKFQYYFENKELLKDAIKKTRFYQTQVERNQETLLGKKYGIDRDVVVVDVETKIPEDEGVVNEVGEAKAPEIDMVIFDSNKNVLYLTEYKCKDISLKNASGVIEHYSDMKQVLGKCKMNLVSSEISVYNMISGKDVNFNDVEVRIALCFSDIDAYKILRVLKNVDEKDDIYVWFGETLDDVDFEKEPETVGGFITKYEQ